MRILIFNWKDIHHPYAGGAEVYLHEMAKVWITNGHTVDWFSPRYRNAPRRETIDKITIYRAGGRFTVYALTPFYYFTHFVGKYDRIIDVENAIPFFTPFYTRTKTTLVILHVHKDVVFRELPLPLAYLAFFLETQLLPLVYRKIPIITISEHSASDIMKYKLTTKKPAIVYPALHIKDYAPGKKTRTPTVAYVGRLKGYKSVDHLIRAFAIVAKKSSRARLIIAGRGEVENELKRLTHELGITQRVTFRGFVTEHEKIKIMQSSWVTVNPSFAEGWGITCIESNACGTPVIASNIGGLRGSVRDGKTGFLYTYGNIEALATNIDRIFNDQKLRTRMNNASLQWAHNFSWEKSARAFLTLLENQRQ